MSIMAWPSGTLNNKHNFRFGLSVTKVRPGLPKEVQIQNLPKRDGPWRAQAYNEKKKNKIFIWLKQ